jgi:hypothetical protein
MDDLGINFKARNHGKLPFVELGMGYDKGMFMKHKITKKKYIKVNYPRAVFSAVPDSPHTVLDAHEKLKEG